MYITTYSGIHFTPLEPQPEQIKIEDIAHAQSMMTRANGHFPEFYSVAQHSAACVQEALARGYGRAVALACLLHDGSEAYLSDITRPVKAALDSYRAIEKELQSAIYRKFLGRVPGEAEMEKIKSVDDTCLYYEFLHYMGERLSVQEPQRWSKMEFVTIPFCEGEENFLKLFYELSTDGK